MLMSACSLDGKVLDPLTRFNRVHQPVQIDFDFQKQDPVPNLEQPERWVESSNQMKYNWAIMHA